MILNRVDLLETLLLALTNTHIRGATILDSHGMAHTLHSYPTQNDNASAFLGSIRTMLNPEREKSKTIMIVLREDQVSVVEEVANRVLGGLDKPDTGFIFTVPVDYIKGIQLNKEEIKSL
jgi:hypothetical protein